MRIVINTCHTRDFPYLMKIQDGIGGWWKVDSFQTRKELRKGTLELEGAISDHPGEPQLAIRAYRRRKLLQQRVERRMKEMRRDPRPPSGANEIELYEALSGIYESLSEAMRLHEEGFFLRCEEVDDWIEKITKLKLEVVIRELNIARR